MKFIEQLTVRCSDLTIGENERSKEAEADFFRRIVDLPARLAPAR